MRAQLIEQVRYCCHHRGGIDISGGEFGSVFEKSLGQRVGSLREQDAGSRAERGLLSPPGKRVGHATAGGIKARRSEERRVGKECRSAWSRWGGKKRIQSTRKC